MTIKLRFALLLGLFLGGLMATLLWLRQMEQAAAAAITERDRASRAQQLNHWIDAVSRTLPQFAADLAQSEDFAAWLARRDPVAAREKIQPALESAGADALWVLRSDGSVLAEVRTPGAASPSPPLTGVEFLSLANQTPSPRFFAQSEGAFFEVCIRRLAAAATSPASWVMVAKSWDERHLRTLSSLTEASVTLAGRHDVAHAPILDSRLTLVRPLADWQGHTLRVLRVNYQIPEVDRTVETSSRQSHVFIAFGLLLIAALAVAQFRWVLRPLRRIEQSLAATDPQLVADLAREKTELGRVAGLVVSSFAHQSALLREVTERRRTQEALERSEAALRENLAERARLGRDLHDGVIQSLYAAGMGLAGIRMQLQPGQVEAATRLEQTRAALNETIHDVRNFIIGLEPEALKLKTFAQAIAALLEVMRGMRAFRSTVDVDEAVAAQLSLSQRVHALQIAREAISNALRHGEASHVHVALRRHADFAEFAVADNGKGFDTTAASQGKGLANFAERARELGGEFIIDSRPGEGARVKLVFALTNL